MTLGIGFVAGIGRAQLESLHKLYPIFSFKHLMVVERAEASIHLVPK